MSAQVAWDCPPQYVAAGAGPTDCVRVDVYRDGTNGSTVLPVWFAPLFGVNSQGVRATATAWATTGNTTYCMRPFSVADKWIEQAPVGPPRAPIITDEYNHWISSGGGVTVVNPADSYAVPAQGINCRGISALRSC
jgi:hypothetical protein